MLRRRASGLIIAGSVAEAEPPAYRCTLCPAEFRKDQGGLYERHVVRCSGEQEERIHAMSPRTKAPGIFGDSGWDTEFEAWVEKNRDALKRDAKRM